MRLAELLRQIHLGSSFHNRPLQSNQDDCRPGKGFGIAPRNINEIKKDAPLIAVLLVLAGHDR
jgi:hypothetical protein